MNISLLIWFCFSISLIYCESIITIPFESKLCKSNENEDFLSNYYAQFLYTPISIGSEKQKLEVALKLNKYITYLISSKNSNLKSEHFNEENSKTYEVVSEKTIKPNEDMFIEGIKSKDNFIFGGKINFEKYLFYLSKEQYFDETGQIGLQMVPSFSDKDFSGNGFIDQLKSKSIINSKNFYFKYEYKDEKEFKYKGNLIIGGMPHEIEPSKILNFENFVQTYVNVDELNSRWNIKLSSVNYGNEVISESDSVEFSTTFGFIVAPLSFLKIYDIFFNNSNCFGDYNNEEKDYLYLYCKKNFDISKFKDLIFIADKNKEFNFTLTYKDLFRKIGEYYYFLILFNKDISQWEFGHIFLKKYMLVFNGDKKTVGYYYQSTNSGNSNNKMPSRSNIVFIFITISVVLLIIIVGLLFYIIVFRPKNRKIRPNELKESFDYSPAQEDKDQDNQLGV